MSGWLAALQPLFGVAFTWWSSPVTWLEIVAFVLALGTVAMNIRVDPLGWPLAIASSLLHVGLFWNSRSTATAPCRSSSRLSPSGASGNGCAARRPTSARLKSVGWARAAAGWPWRC